MHIKNPMIWADYPDPDIIRIGGAYYMVTTTMFFIPAAPIMRSDDLVNWEIVSYITGGIEGYEEVGRGYGRGQWATSLRQRDGKIHAFFTCLDLGKSFLYTTDDIEKSNWDCLVLDAPYHDASIVFDGSETYLVYGAGDIRIVKFCEDLSGLVADSDRLLFSTPEENMALRCEGCRSLYRNGWHYLFFIDIPEGGIRREWCYRSRSVCGPYESKLIADSTCGHHNIGVAQGMAVDTPQGDWYMVLFGDAGAVGRLPFLFPLSWEDDWPVIGAGQGMQLAYEVPLREDQRTAAVFGDSFDHRENKLGLFWQWNHNPDDTKWSFTENPGQLTLHSTAANDFLHAGNTLTQRTCGPESEFSVWMDTGNLKPGDQAGIGALQWDYAICYAKVLENGEKRICSCKRSVKAGEKEGEAAEYFAAPLEAGQLWLKAVFDYRNKRDTVQFFYSHDGVIWHAAGEKQKLHFNLIYFVGTRIALYCFGSGSGHAAFRRFTAKVNEVNRQAGK